MRRTLTDHTSDLAGRILEEIDDRFRQGAYSSYELIMAFGIISDKHVNFKKLSALDEAKNVEVHWPAISPLTQEEIELERQRVKEEYENKSREVD